MPITVTLKRRTIYLNTEMERIFKMFDEALAGQNIPVRRDKKRQNQDPDHAVTVAPVAEMSVQGRRGIFTTAIRALEQASGDSYGGYFCELPEQYIDLDSETKAYFDEYKQSLIKALKSENVSSLDVERIEVRSRFALTYILLYRLVGHALQCKDDSLNNAISLVAALDNFQQKLICSGILNSTRFERVNAGASDIVDFKIPRSEYDQFVGEISTNKVSLSTDIKNIIHSVQLLHHHTMKISAGKTLLENTRRTIECQLLACLAPNTVGSDFDEAWYKSALLDITANIPVGARIGDNGLLHAHNDQLAYNRLSQKQSQQIAYLVAKGGLDKIVINKIERLWKLLNTIEIIIQEFNCLDDLFRLISWVPILNGSIDLQAIHDFLISLSNTVKVDLVIDSSLVTVLGSEVVRHLRAQNVDTGANLAVQLGELGHDILSLKAHEIRSFVMRSMCKTMKDMQEIDRCLPPEFRFIRHNGPGMEIASESTQNSSGPHITEVEDNDESRMIEEQPTVSRSVISRLYHRFTGASRTPQPEHLPLLLTDTVNSIESREKVAVSSARRKVISKRTVIAKPVISVKRTALAKRSTSVDKACQIELSQIAPTSSVRSEGESSLLITMLTRLIQGYSQSPEDHQKFKKFWQILCYTQSTFFYNMDSTMRAYYKHLYQYRLANEALCSAKRIERVLSTDNISDSARQWATTSMQTLFHCNEAQLKTKIAKLERTMETKKKAVFGYENSRLHLSAQTHKGWSNRNYEFLVDFLLDTGEVTKGKVTQFLSDITDLLSQRKAKGTELTTLLEITLAEYSTESNSVHSSCLAVGIPGLIVLGADPRQWLQNNLKEGKASYHLITKQLGAVLSHYQQSARFLDDTILCLGTKFERLLTEMDLFGRKLHDCVDSDNAAFWKTFLGKRLYKDGARAERAALLSALLDWIYLIFNEPVVVRNGITQNVSLSDSISVAKKKVDDCKNGYYQAIKNTTQFEFLYNFGRSQCQRLMTVVEDIHQSLMRLGTHRLKEAEQLAQAQIETAQEKSLKEAAESEKNAALKRAEDALEREEDALKRAEDALEREKALKLDQIASMKIVMRTFIQQSIPNSSEYEPFKLWMDSQQATMMIAFPTVDKRIVQEELLRLLIKEFHCMHLTGVVSRYRYDELPASSLIASRDTFFGGSAAVAGGVNLGGGTLGAYPKGSDGDGQRDFNC